MEAKKKLWDDQFWIDGNFFRTVGDKNTKEIIKEYIEYHQHFEKALISKAYTKFTT